MVIYPSANEIRQQQRTAGFARSNSTQSMDGQQRQSNPHLSQNQQDLLVAALNSQATGRQNTNQQISASEDTTRSRSDSAGQQAAMNGSSVFMSPTEAEFDNLAGDYTPDLDYLDGDNFDFENADLGGEMIGALPGDGSELHEKRKNSEDDEGKDGDAKRQDTQEGEKGAKKPGRKPLTSEPTTKRKAQNRAAQRAFRERKEQHLKDLETKVNELTKTQEADKHENGMLKAQVDRLQIELREYRKRLSLNAGSGANRSPPTTGYGNSRSNSNPSAYQNPAGNFQFDFPKFGALPGSQIFGNQGYSNGSNRTSATPPLTQSPTGSISGPSQPQDPNSREISAGRSLSPKSLNGSNSGSPGQIANLNSTFNSYSTNTNMHGFASTLPQMSKTASDPFGDLFSPSILKSASIDSTGNYFGNGTPMTGGVNLNGGTDVNGGDSTAGLNRVFQFNSGSSASDSASPSASSASQWNANANSSCGTSPEPSHDSPANKPKNAETFCDKINPRNSIGDTSANQTSTNNITQSSTGDYSIPSLDSFDPVLFSDYRDNQDSLLGGGDFTGGFFDEALNPIPFDYSSPSNLFGILQSPELTNTSLNVPTTGAANAPSPSRNLMADMDKIRDGGDDDYGLPNTQQKKTNGSGKLISCNNIWNQLQSNPDFQEGKFDLDGLCSELRAKARCSESGVMVDQDHVDQALRKLGKKDEQGKAYPAPHGLMFEQESWDKVIQKMNGS